jgi:hypothetical protein
MSDPQAGIIAPSFEAAQAEQDRRRGPNMRLKPTRKYRLLIAPAFKVVDGKGIWYSVRRKHWKIPVPGTADFKTFTCPKELGTSCYICDMADAMRPTLPQMAKDFAPNLSYMFNVIDADNAGFGVQQLEDGATLFNLFLGIVQTLPTVADPVQGQVITVVKLTQPPWRTAIPGAVLSYDELGLPIETAYAENLKDLDEVWQYISDEEQRAMFAAIEANPHQFANLGRQGQLPPVAAPVGATPVAGFPIPSDTPPPPAEVAPIEITPVSTAPAPAAPAAVAVAPPPPAGPVPVAMTPAAGVPDAAPSAAPAPSADQVDAAAAMQARMEEAAAKASG